MNEWMNRWMNEWIYGSVGELIKGWMDQKMNRS